MNTRCVTCCKDVIIGKTGWPSCVSRDEQNVWALWRKLEVGSDLGTGRTTEVLYSLLPRSSLVTPEMIGGAGLR